MTVYDPPDGPSLLVDGGSDYDFKITRVHITPLTAHLATNLRATPAGTCGADRSLWRAGASVDITPTGGCAALGLKLPLLERELIKVEREAKGDKLLLYLGQIATDANAENKHKPEPKRPTSYQPALLQCRQREPRRQPVAMELLPEIMAQPLTAASSSSSVINVPTYLSLLLCVIIITIIPVIRCQSMFGSCR